MQNKRRTTNRACCCSRLKRNKRDSKTGTRLLRKYEGAYQCLSHTPMPHHHQAYLYLQSIALPSEIGVFCKWIFTCNPFFLQSQMATLFKFIFTCNPCCHQKQLNWVSRPKGQKGGGVVQLLWNTSLTMTTMTQAVLASALKLKLSVLVNFSEEWRRRACGNG